MKLTEFMRTDFYLSYLDDLDKKMLVKIDRVSIVQDIILKIELDSLNYASLTLGDIKWLIENYRFKTMHYILKKQANILNQMAARIILSIWHLR